MASAARAQDLASPATPRLHLNQFNFVNRKKKHPRARRSVPLEPDSFCRPRHCFGESACLLAPIAEPVALFAAALCFSLPRAISVRSCADLLVTWRSRNCQNCRVAQNYAAFCVPTCRKAARVPFRSHSECVKKPDPAHSLRESCRLFRAPVARFGPLAIPATALLSRCGSSVQTLDQ